MIQSKFIDLDQVRIHYAEEPGPGAALLLLHGITGALETFTPLLPRLAQQAHVYVLDLRGHGRSSRRPGAYHVSDYGHDIVGFLGAVIGQPAVIAGHSLGGLIALWVSANAPGQVRSLFLADPPLYITQPPRLQESMYHGIFTMLREFLRQHHADGGTLEGMVAFVSQLPANATQTMLEAAGPEAVRLRAVELQQVDPAILDPAIEGNVLDGCDPNELLAQLRCPVHLLAAQVELGGVLDAQDVAHFAAQTPHATYAVLHDVGHSIHQERPEAFVQAVQQCIAQ